MPCLIVDGVASRPDSEYAGGDVTPFDVRKERQLLMEEVEMVCTFILATSHSLLSQ